MTIIREATGYLPTFLKDDKYDPKTGVCTLIIRRFTVKDTKRGLRTYITTDALDFPDEDAMVAWIEAHDAFELPPEADGNPRFIPTWVRS